MSSLHVLIVCDINKNIENYINDFRTYFLISLICGISKLDYTPNSYPSLCIYFEQQNTCFVDIQNNQFFKFQNWRETMLVVGFQFVQNFIHESEVALKINQTQSFQVYNDVVFFWLIKFPDLDYYSQQTKDQLMQLVKRYKRRYDISKLKLCPYLLQYDGVYISYPFTCFIHQPIKDSLLNFLKDQGCSLGAKVLIMHQISKCIQMLHKSGICVRSLKTKDIFVLDTMEIRIADISQYTMLDQQGQIISKKLEQKSEYVAPEVLKDKDYNLSCDIWTMGVVFYQVLYGRKIQDFNNIQSNFTEEVPLWANRLLRKMICLNPNQRYQIKDICKIVKNAHLCSSTSQVFSSSRCP